MQAKRGFEMKKNCWKLILVPLVLGFVCFASSWAAPLPKYSITHITLGGTESEAYAINDQGQVVGTSDISGDTSSHGFIYYEGTMTDIGPIYPSNINNIGQVVGQFSTEINDDFTFRSFIYSNGILTDLGIISPDLRAQSWANGINDSGQVVGSANTVYIGSHFHAYLYSDGAMKDIDTIGPFYEQSEAWAINNNGMVVGSERDGGIFIYNEGVMTRLNIFGNALDVNDLDEIVGWALGASYEYLGAFLYKEGEITFLGNLGGSVNTAARAINESSQIVGFSEIGYVERPWGYDNIDHAFLYDNGVMTDLNTLIPQNSGWELMEAFDINNNGQIVGYGVLNGNFQTLCFEDDYGYTHCYNYPVYSAFLLTPDIADADGDGIPDSIDSCPASNLTATIIIGGCDTGVDNQLFSDGCTMIDEIEKCEVGANNHGAFVSCVAHLTKDWKTQRFIRAKENGAIKRCAAKAPSF